MSEEQRWNEQVSHPLQSWEWGEFRRKNGNLISRINGLQVVWSRVPKTPWYFGTLLKSRIPNSKDLEALTAEGKKIGGVGVRIEPLAQKGKVPSRLIKGRRFFTPKTFWLDLTKSEEELLAAMHSKARYNIRLAQRRGVVVKEDNSSAAFAKYLDLVEKTAIRQGFYAHDRRYHQLLWSVLRQGYGGQGPIAHLFVAKYQGEILAAWIIFKFGDKIYYPYGAGTDQYKQVQAPSLLLWETALWGKKLGCKIYDLWGVEEGKGFTDFKAKFGPRVVEFVGTYDLVINPLLYWLFRLAEWLRWQILDRVRHTPNISRE